MSTNASVITVGGAGVANQSVSGTVQVGNFPTTQNVSGSVVSFQGTNPWIITGSVQGNFVTGNSSVQVLNFPANQSVSGAVSISNFPTTQNVSGSVVATQGTSPWVVAPNNSSYFALQPAGSVLAVSGSFTPAANQSVSGTVQTDVRGSVAVVIIGGSVATATTNSSVMLLGSTAVIGSVMTLQGTNPWIITGSIQGSFSAGNSSVQVLNFPTNQSVSGTVGASIIGQPIFQIGNGASIATIRDLAGNDALNVAIVDASGNQITTFGTSNQSVSGTVAVTQSTTPWNIAGSVASFQAGTQITSVSGQVTVVSSLAGGIFPVSGSVAATITNTNVNVSGSVVAFQGTTPWNIAGSVAAVQTGTATTSIAGVVSVFGTINVFPSSIVSGHASVNGAASVQVLPAPVLDTRKSVT